MPSGNLACVSVSDACLLCVLVRGRGRTGGQPLPRAICRGIRSLAVASLRPPVLLLVRVASWSRPSHVQPKGLSPAPPPPAASSPQLLRKHTSKQSRSFNHSVELGRGGGGVSEMWVGIFLLSWNFENSLLLWQDSAMHVKTRF